MQQESQLIVVFRKHPSLVGDTIRKKAARRGARKAGVLRYLPAALLVDGAKPKRRERR